MTVKKDERLIYDTTDDCYVEDVGNDFESVQEFLANQWVDEGDDSYYKDVHDKIMTAKIWDQLEEYAAGLGYLLEEDEDNA